MRDVSRFIILAFLFSVAFEASAVQIVSGKKNPICEERNLNKDLNIYVDPALFLSDIGAMMHLDPGTSVEDILADGPVLTKRRGKLNLMFLDEQSYEFNNIFFRMLQPATKRRMQQKKGANADPSKPVKILRVKICGGANDPYADSVGFIVEEELRLAQAEDLEEGLPPSVYPNPIPVLRKQP